MKPTKFQEIIRAEGGDGWLLTDFRGRDPLSYKVLGISPEPLASRRWFYYVPARGKAIRLVSAVEATRLDGLPGEKRIYKDHLTLRRELRRLCEDRKIIMNYSPLGAVPYISFVDAGTLELIQAAGGEVVSSKDALQHLFALKDGAKKLQKRAAQLVDQVRRDAFTLIGRAAKKGGVHELAIQEFILDSFNKKGLVTNHAPIVGVNEHPADPHFELTAKNSRRIKPGDAVLIDLWAKLKKRGAIYFDSTWVGFVGSKPPAEYLKVFRTVLAARDAAINLVVKSYQAGRKVRGCEVDRAAREVIEMARFGRYFVHRTGHSIGEDTHGDGANIDGFETYDDRELIKGSSFSIEPGIYLPGRFGIRSETDLYIDSKGKVEVVGELQRELLYL